MLACWHVGIRLEREHGSLDFGLWTLEDPLTFVKRKHACGYSRNYYLYMRSLVVVGILVTLVSRGSLAVIIQWVAGCRN